MTALTTLDRDARRRAVLGVTSGPGDVDGIDFVEVLANRPGSAGEVPEAPRQRTVVVHLLKRAVPAGWDAARVEVTGGVRADPRVNPVGVGWAAPAVDVVGDGGEPAPDEPFDAADRLLVADAVPQEARASAFVVRTTTSGDWSTYTLRLLGDDGTGHPDGFDPVLSTAPFRFTVDCPSDLDCATEDDCPPAPELSPVLDYLARDYDALRVRLLDRLSTLVPGWGDRHPADVGVMLVELFAHLGDRLASWQDAVAVEAYLGTARLRTSVRRHARLLDYRVHEGCSARVLLAFTTVGDVDLPAGTPVADSRPEGPEPARPVDAVEIGAVVVETTAPATLRTARNSLPLHAWGDTSHCLPVGATAAFVRADPGPDGPGLARGDLLVLADTPRGTVTGGGDPTRRFAVRLDRDPVAHRDEVEGADVLELHWHPEDALPAPLLVSEPGEDGGPAVRAVALANVVLADDGATVAGEDVLPAGGRDGQRRLARSPLAFAEPVADTTSGGPGAAGQAGARSHGAALRSATTLLAPRPGLAVAQLVLDDGRRTWHPVPDLLASDRSAAHVVAEPEGDVVRLRFGDGTLGRRPAQDAPLRAWYRVGGGRHGNVAADRLTLVLDRPDGTAPVPAGVTVSNPLPARGGVDAQPLDEVRELAPQEFRHQLRAVTSPDYAAVAADDPGVHRAVARRRWTGSWYAQEVTVDPVAARAGDTALLAALTTVLEARRMAAVDVVLTDPVDVPLRIVLSGCVVAGYHRAHVAAGLAERLSAGALTDGRRGFFHPDGFTFGQALYLSDLVAAAMEVPGLSWVEVVRFGPAGASEADSAAAIDAGVLTVGPREVLRCDSDPNNPEAGHVEVRLGGGS